MSRTAIAMAEPADINVDELRRRARRRLVGAVVLALGVAVVVPMLLETEQKPLGEDISVKIPPVDSGKFVNRLNEGAPQPDASAAHADDAAKSAAAPPASEASAERPRKYDTRVPESAPAASAPVTVTNIPDTPAASAPTAAAAATSGTDSGAATKAPASKNGTGETAKSAPASAQAATDATKGGSASHPDSPREGFAVQLAAFADDRGANSLAGRLKKAGYAAYTEPLKTSKGTLWRVRVGPYPSREAAVAARDKLKTAGQSGIVAAIK
jgi:DedD protein